VPCRVDGELVRRGSSQSGIRSESGGKVSELLLPYRPGSRSAHREYSLSELFHVVEHLVHR
jgi:hypothetical protein